jgi:hypothetical protein
MLRARFSSTRVVHRRLATTVSLKHLFQSVQIGNADGFPSQPDDAPLGQISQTPRHMDAHDAQQRGDLLFAQPISMYQNLARVS